MTTTADELQQDPGSDDPETTIAEPADGAVAAAEPVAALFVQRTADGATKVRKAVLRAPDIIGMGLLEAHAAANGLGLHLEMSIWETKLGPWGMVLAQRPEPGSRIRAGATIHAVLAGRPHKVVPDVVGLTLPMAVEILRRMGLQPLVVAQRSVGSAEMDTVVSSKPPAGTPVVDGTRVSLVISPGR